MSPYAVTGHSELTYITVSLCLVNVGLYDNYSYRYFESNACISKLLKAASGDYT